ncbi:MAG: leucine-rich repeat protein [Lachnospiraceae bacterium]|nr:leucine-rich repeat protein [Lachnospiraceae bacterium]
MNKKVIIKKIMIGGISALLAASGPLAGAMPIVEAAEQAQDINAVISLHLNGGTLPEDTNLIFDSRTDTVLPIPIRLGYQFAGWYSNENFSGTATAVLPAGSAQNSTTYYAKWEPMVYTIGFETYGGSIAGEVPKQYATGTELQLPDKITKENCDFAGWYDNPEFIGEPLTSIAKSDTGNRIFYAKWKIKSYRIVLNLDGGTLPQGTVLTFDIGTNAFLPTPTKENYSFAGWYDNDSFQGAPISIISEKDYGDRTLYAKWLPDNCNITLDLNGGSLMDGTDIKHTPGTKTTLPIPVYEGFAFEGWYLSESFAGEPVTVIPADASGNLTYYAKWSYETKPAVQPSIKDKTLKPGTLATIGKTTYKISSSKKHTVAFIESYDSNITVPATVKLSGATYKVTSVSSKACRLNAKAKSIVIGKNVTSIGKYAFDGCRNLKKITVKSISLKAIGKKALRGINPKCIIKVPESKFNSYKKLFKKKGQADTVKIKKIL